MGWCSHDRRRLDGNQSRAGVLHDRRVRRAPLRHAQDEPPGVLLPGSGVRHGGHGGHVNHCARRIRQPRARGDGSAGDHPDDHSRRVGERRPRAQEPRSDGELPPLQRGRVDDLADPLFLRHAHGHPRNRLVHERRLRRGTHRGGHYQPDPLPARGYPAGVSTMEARATSAHNTHKARSTSGRDRTYSSPNTTTTPSPPIDTFSSSIRP